MTEKTVSLVMPRKASPTDGQTADLDEEIVVLVPEGAYLQLMTPTLPDEVFNQDVEFLHQVLDAMRERILVLEKENRSLKQHAVAARR